jgi:hypothetical protein
MSIDLFPAGPESEPTALPKWVNVKRCLTVDCSACGTSLGIEDDGITFHYPTLTELRKDADAVGWTFPEDGPLCQDCTDDAEDVTA